MHFDDSLFPVDVMFNLRNNISISIRNVHISIALAFSLQQVQVECGSNWVRENFSRMSMFANAFNQIRKWRKCLATNLSLYFFFFYYFIFIHTYDNLNMKMYINDGMPFWDSTNRLYSTILMTHNKHLWQIIYNSTSLQTQTHTLSNIRFHSIIIIKSLKEIRFVCVSIVLMPSVLMWIGLVLLHQHSNLAEDTLHHGEWVITITKQNDYCHKF